MLIHYLKAAEGDVGYIKDLIERDKNSINRLYDGSFKLQVSDYAMFSLYAASTILTIASAGSLAPLALVLNGITGISTYAGIHYSKEALCLRKNWTLIDFAAERGQTEVARVLIKNGADTSNRFFLNVAASNNQHQFVEACSDLLELKGKTMSTASLQKENQKLTEELEQAQSNLDTELANARTVEQVNNQHLKILQIENIIQQYEKEKYMVKYSQLLDELNQDNAEDPINDAKIMRDCLAKYYQQIDKALAKIYPILCDAEDHVFTQFNIRLEKMHNDRDSFERAVLDADRHYRVVTIDKRLAIREAIKFTTTYNKYLDCLKNNTFDFLSLSKQDFIRDELGSFYQDINSALYSICRLIINQDNAMFDQFNMRIEQLYDVRDRIKTAFDLIDAQFPKPSAPNNPVTTPVSTPQPVATPPHNKQPPRPSSPTFFKANTDAYPYGLSDRCVPFVPGDCFYHAVIACRPDRRWPKAFLRSSIRNELLKSREKYDEFIRDDQDRYRIEIYDDKSKTSTFEYYENYEEYCESVLEPKTWAGEIEIRAFSEANKICCITVDKNDHRYICQYGMEHLSDANPPIFLGFTNKNHFVALQCSKNLTWQDVIAGIEQDKNPQPH